MRQSPLLASAIGNVKLALRIAKIFGSPETIVTTMEAIGFTAVTIELEHFQQVLHLGVLRTG